MLSNLGEVIRQNIISLKEAQGLSSTQIAKACSVSKPTVTNWINGRNSVDKEHLLMLSRLFGVSLAALTGAEGGREMSTDTECSAFQVVGLVIETREENPRIVARFDKIPEPFMLADDYRARVITNSFKYPGIEKAIVRHLPRETDAQSGDSHQAAP